ncbi:MAG: 4-(cytidine 5'-diphospho)-2-C-methyl-D-erythritol kinase [Mariprofundaceae bacterium]|nr:4-(cytidine 5'-diphospho)-2-C-methyl-D-erythritol kinase [Mariprofundaceae bacterium]
MIEIPAPAKINLHLRITGITADGYHLLDTSFAYTDVCDVLHISTAENLDVSCSDPTLNGADNLVFRVLDALRRQYRINQGLRVHIEKHIPAQAGLGGGSSDAASALIAANHFWQLGLNSRQLITFATPFGADIPCFLFGQSSLASGIGEQLLPLDLSTMITPEIRHIVLAHPGSGLSTTAVFAKFDSQFSAANGSDNGTGSGQLTPSETKATIRAGLTGDMLPVGENMLESVSCAMSSALVGLLSGMKRTHLQSWMSGSGTACVSRCENATDAERLADRLITEGCASWSHAGRLLSRHPLQGSGIEPDDWGVAKR